MLFDQGRPLNALERARYAPYFACNVIEQTRIVEGKTPFWLRPSMCAVVIGHRIFLRAGVYNADTARGINLLGHELTHVSQFLHGMTVLKYLWSCRHGYRQSCYEQEAYAKGAMIAKTYIATIHHKTDNTAV
ncbi:MAG TPA: DUF4157 domain-containing protein [Methylophilus sp.]